MYTCSHRLRHKNLNLGTPSNFFRVFNTPVAARVLRHLETAHRRVTRRCVGEKQGAGEETVGREDGCGQREETRRE